MSRVKETATIAGISVSVVAVGIAAVMLGGSDPEGAAGGASSFPRLEQAGSGPVVIDQIVDETFTPATQAEIDANADKVISPHAAFERYIKADNWSLPDDATVTEGYLTLPLGAGTPGEYTANHQLVYGYQWHECGPVVTPVRPADAETSPGQTEPPVPHCTSWTFLDATTGELVDRTWSE